MGTRIRLLAQFGLFTLFLAVPLWAEQTQDKKQPDKGDFFKGGPGGFGPGQRTKLIPQFDKDGDGRLNTEERAAARQHVQKTGKKGFGKGFPGGKGGFGPGGMMVKPLLEATDSDNDGMLTQAELTAGIKKFFAAADKDKKGSLTPEQFADALTRILPQPRGFPGFGGPKEGPKDGPKDGGFKGPPKGGFFNPGPALVGAIIKRADLNKDGKLTLDELEKAADGYFREVDKEKKTKLDGEAMAAALNQLIPPPEFGPPGGFGKGRETAKPGPKVSPADVKAYPDAKLYDTSVLRTLFIEFDNTKDWEAELADFYHTDVEIPATLTVDGKKYPNVGIHFRGNSSFFGIPAGYKRSLNLSFDFIDTKQRLHGYKTLNLLNCNQDPTLMHSVLFSHVARQYMAAPQANFVKVVINGESWGLYANVQQVNKDFLKENYKTTGGARWRVPGRPGADSGLRYLGENVQDYKRYYEIKTEDREKDWKALVELCRILDKTPPEKLEAALKPILDLDEVLWFLAIDNAVINDDGYWTRASDYILYRDPKGKFHVIPYDTNETFMPMGFGGPKGGFGKGGPPDKKDGGFGKGGGKGGYALDPLVDVNNTRTPLHSKLLAVPSLRAMYLKNVRTIADKSFDWKTLQPTIAQWRTLLEKEVELDTRKMISLADFKAATADKLPEGGLGVRGSLRAFADGRREYLLSHPEIKKLTP
jgi:spore coat protein CotH